MTNEIRVTFSGIYLETIPGTMPVVAAATPNVRIKKAGTRAMHKLLPEEITGYAFDPKYSWWGILVPEYTKNLVDNPSFELGSYTDIYTPSNWTTSTVTYAADAGATRGRYSLELDPPASWGSGARPTILCAPNQLVAAGPVTFSVDVFTPSPGMIVQIEINVAATVIAKSNKTLHQAGWQRLSITGTSSAGGAAQLNLRLTEDSINFDKTIYVDGFQLEELAYPTTYTDGDMIGWFDKGPFQSYLWEGARHASPSTRKKTTGTGGRFTPLSKYKFLTTGIIGLGMTGVEEITRIIGRETEIHDDTKIKSRTFTIAGRIFGCKTYKDLAKARDGLINLVKPNNTIGREPVILRYQPAQQNGVTYGFPVDIQIVYTSGLEGAITNLYQESIAFQFHSNDPFPSETIETAETLNKTATSDTDSIVYQDEFGAYQSLGTLGAIKGIGDGEVFDAGFLESGEPVICGNFDTFAGDANEYICYWSGSNWVWVGDEPDGVVRVMLLEEKTFDGSQWFGGDFGTWGIATMRYITYKPSGGVYTEPSNGLNGAVNVIEPDNSGNYYIGGEFTADGPGTDTDLSYIARYRSDTDVWENLDLGLDGIVHTILSTNDGLVYIGGEFDNFQPGGPVQPAAKVVQWNNRAGSFVAMGDGFDDTVHKLFKGPDGSIYAVGDFLMDGTSTYNLRGFARWDGVNWEEVAPILGEMNDATVDEDGITWISCWGSGGAGSPTEVAGDVIFGYRDGVFFPQPFTFSTSSGVQRALRIGKNGQKIWIVNDTVIKVPGVTNVTYSGEADAPFTMLMKGNFNPIHIKNLDTGGEIYFRKHSQSTPFEIEANEEMTVMFDGARNWVFSDIRPNLRRHVVLGASNPSGMFLRPGENRIHVFAPDSGTTHLWMKWKNKYWSIDKAGEE